MVGICQWRPRAPGLAALLDEPVSYLPFCGRRFSRLAVWGGDTDPAIAIRLSARLHLPWVRVTHGFLRPLGQKPCAAPLSVIVEDARISGDAGTGSRLERLVGTPHAPAERERARNLIQRWREGRLSEYNDLREEPVRVPGDYVLVVGETPKDQSVSDELTGSSRLQTMIETAMDEHPDSQILVKAGPAAPLGRRFESSNGRTALVGEVHPAGLLEHSRAVYTIDSNWGFEALLWGRPVRTFGMPFYAGWGLTEDTVPVPDCRSRATLEDLVHAALVDCSRYRNPESGRACEAEELIDWLTLQRRMRERFPATLYAAGFSLRKRRFVREFLQGSTVHFVRKPKDAPRNATLVVWGRQKAAAGANAECRSDAERSPVRIEDGFLRSVGLGAGFARPLSWTIDRTGIYYDATTPSDLEHLLQTGEFDPRLLARARKLREKIVSSGVTKYNLDAGPWKRPPGRVKIVLVPGQVESDASLGYGAPGLRTNLALLQAVRAANPGSFLVYKPHPDVQAGLRARGAGEEDARDWCDELATGASMGQLLMEVDEVHVLTSLAGFEALLRGKSVTCHGQPFYAGWGLTTDLCPVARRTRLLSLDALVAGSLIVYPTYVSRATNRFTTPERILEELQEWRAESVRRPPGPIQKLGRRLFHSILRRLNDPARIRGTNVVDVSAGKSRILQLE